MTKHLAYLRSRPLPVLALAMAYSRVMARPTATTTETGGEMSIEAVPPADPKGRCLMPRDPSETTRELLRLGNELQAADRLIQRAIRADAKEQAATLKAIREDLARFLEDAQ